MKPVKWGILGAAKFAAQHMGPAIAMARGGDLVALATRDVTKAATFEVFAPGLRVHTSYDALLADPEIEAVYIPLPNHMHLEWSLKAIAAGKHVLSEKPMTLRASEFDRLIEARDASGLHVAEAYMIVFHEQWQRAREIVKAGQLGQIWRIDGAFSFNNRDAGNIRNQSAAGGGGIRDIGVYTMGSARFVMGVDPTCVMAHVLWEEGVDVYARVTAQIGTADYSTFTSIRMHPRQEMTFHGEDGVLRLSTPFNARVFGEAQIHLTQGLTTTVERFPTQNQYVTQVEAFHATIRKGTPYPCPLEFSQGTQAMIDAAFASALATRS